MGAVLISTAPAPTQRYLHSEGTKSIKFFLSNTDVKSKTRRSATQIIGKMFYIVANTTLIGVSLVRDVGLRTGLGNGLLANV